jgi:CubicO group peptidase (beta-lactamase class C family)
MVISHRTGFPNWRIKDQPLEFFNQPGETFGYSGEGFVYLQKAIEHLLSIPFNDMMIERVFHPLAMKKSSFVWKKEFDLLTANGHTLGNKSVKKDKIDEPNAAGTLHTTAQEYALFVMDVLRLRHDKSNVLKTTKLMREVLTPQPQLSSELSWGLGWGLQETPYGSSFWHWGDNGVFRNFVIGFIENELGIVILTNSKKGIKFFKVLFNQVLESELPCFKVMSDPTPYFALERK